MRLILTCFSFCLYTTFFTHTAFSWGADGHKITAFIAYELLHEPVREKIDGILGGESFTDASTWADRVRNMPDYQWTRPLHYINVPRDADEIELERDCINGECVIGAIHTNLETLADENADLSKQKEAVRFVLHFIGDLHQPLHVSYADDRGGNHFNVYFFDKPDNLHAVWDSGLIERREPDWKRYAQVLLEQVRNEGIPALSKTDITEWGEESLKITKEVVYDVPADRKLGEEYFNKSISFIEARLKLAGVRTAALFNEIFQNR